MKNLKTLNGTAITAKRAAAALIHDRLQSVYYATDNIDGEIDGEMWSDIADEIAKILTPFEERLDTISKDVDSNYALAAASEDPSRNTVFADDVDSPHGFSPYHFSEDGKKLTKEDKGTERL